MTRLSDKLNNVRRLQEMGMMSSFPTTMSQTEATPKMYVDANQFATQIISIDGKGTMSAQKANIMKKEDKDLSAVMEKI